MVRANGACSSLAFAVLLRGRYERRNTAPIDRCGARQTTGGDSSTWRNHVSELTAHSSQKTAVAVAQIVTQIVTQIASHFSPTQGLRGTVPNSKQLCAVRCALCVPPPIPNRHESTMRSFVLVGDVSIVSYELPYHTVLLTARKNTDHHTSEPCPLAL
jgi:hypothetical protein